MQLSTLLRILSPSGKDKVLEVTRDLKLLKKFQGGDTGPLISKLEKLIGSTLQGQDMYYVTSFTKAHKKEQKVKERTKKRKPTKSPEKLKPKTDHDTEPAN